MINLRGLPRPDPGTNIEVTNTSIPASGIGEPPGGFYTGTPVEQRPGQTIGTLVGGDTGDDWSSIVPMSQDEQDLTDAQIKLTQDIADLDEWMQPYLLDIMGYEFNEQTGQMDKKAGDELVTGYEARIEAALRGDDTKNLALERDLAREKAQSREEMSRRLGGSGYLQSTAGIQSEAMRVEGAGIRRDQSRRQDLTQFGNLLSQRKSGLLAEQQTGYSQMQGLLDPKMQLLGGQNTLLNTMQSGRGLEQQGRQFDFSLAQRQSDAAQQQWQFEAGLAHDVRMGTDAADRQDASDFWAGIGGFTGGLGSEFFGRFF